MVPTACVVWVTNGSFQSLKMYTDYTDQLTREAIVVRAFFTAVDTESGGSSQKFE
jgi:hypothetical protein